jgi:hemerythrin superfamily protein
MADKNHARRDVVTLVRRQHDDVRRLFDEVEAAGPDRRRKAFQPLVRLLAVHETAEELVIYPSLLLVGSQARRVADARKAEEDAAKKALARLEGLDPRSSTFLDELGVFRADVEAHAHAEETEILPLLEQHRSVAELQAMEVAFKTAEMIAPTHAHRFAPESAIGNLLLGPAVAMVDRIRDLLPT